MNGDLKQLICVDLLTSIAIAQFVVVVVAGIFVSKLINSPLGYLVVTSWLTTAPILGISVDPLLLTNFISLELFSFKAVQYLYMIYPS